MAASPVSGAVLADAGAFPGVDTLDLPIADADCTATSAVTAWIVPLDTADHSIDEHIVCAPEVFAHSPTVGGFTITLRARGVGDGRFWGEWSLGWRFQYT